MTEDDEVGMAIPIAANEALVTDSHAAQVGGEWRVLEGFLHEVKGDNVASRG